MKKLLLLLCLSASGAKAQSAEPSTVQAGLTGLRMATHSIAGSSRACTVAARIAPFSQENCAPVVATAAIGVDRLASTVAARSTTAVSEIMTVVVPVTVGPSARMVGKAPMPRSGIA